MRSGILVLCGVVVGGVLFGGAPHLAAQEQGSSRRDSPGYDFSHDRGFVMAKGSTLRRGEGYVAALFPGTLGVAYGATDRVTVQGGTVPWTLANSVVTAFATVRYGFYQDGPLDVALGGFGAIAIDGAETLLAGWPFVAATAGTDAFAVSGLFGVGSSTDIFDTDLTGKVLLQGMAEARLVGPVKLIAEGLYLGEGSTPAGAGGVRFITSRVIFEIGVLRAFESNEPVYPWLALAYRL